MVETVSSGTDHVLLSGWQHCKCSPFGKLFGMYSFFPCHNCCFPVALGFGIPFRTLANVINSMNVLVAAVSFSVSVVGFCSIDLFSTVVCRFLVASCCWVSYCAKNLAFSLFSSSKSLIFCAMLAYPIIFFVAGLFAIFQIPVM